jgi:hypothetical protein
MNAERDDLARDPDLAVLDQALAERLAGEAPPDLWPRVHAALRGAPAPAHRRHGWLVAALLLLALGTAAVFAVTREAADDVPAVAPDDAGSPSGPRTLEELQQRLAAATKAIAQARGCWSAAAAQWVAFPRFPLDDLFRSALRPQIDLADVHAIVAGLAGATLAASRDRIVWTHELSLTSGKDGCALLLQVGGPDAPRVAFRGPDGAVPIAAPCFPFATLQPQLTELARTTVAQLGLVIGAGGFAAVPESAKSLRLIGVPASEVTELARFRAAGNIDLSRSPACHRTEVLQHLDPERIADLWLAPEHLARDAYPVLGALHNLRELHLVGGDWLAIFAGREPFARAPSLDDAAVAALNGLTKLKQLTLAGGSFGDDALTALAALPIERLSLIDCPRVHGHSLGALRNVKALAVRGIAPDGSFASQVATLPLLWQLSLFDIRGELGLADLRGAPKLRSLQLDGRLDRGELVHLAGCAALEELMLRLTPPLRDDELGLLHGLTRLRRIEIVSDAVTPAGRDALRKALPDCKIGADVW